MSDGTSGSRLTESARTGDHAGVMSAMEAGARLDERDGDDWSSLDWAAGRGDVTLIQLLLDRGADPCAMGRELRTPYQIALAAGHLDAARVLRAAEEAADPSSAQRHVWRPFCKAYQLGQLRRFPHWPRQPAGEQPGAATPGAGDATPEQTDLTDETVVFIHDDFTVTRAMWPGEDMIFADVTPAWTQFCLDQLGFRVPDDFDLVPDAPAEGRHAPEPAAAHEPGQG